MNPETQVQGGVDFIWIVLFFMVVALSLIAPYLIRRNRQLKQLESRPSDLGRAPDLRIRETTDRALVELLETGREISAQVDTKVRLLNKLVKDADEQATRLQTLLDQLESAYITQDNPVRPDDRSHKKTVQSEKSTVLATENNHINTTHTQPAHENPLKTGSSSGHENNQKNDASNSENKRKARPEGWSDLHDEVDALRGQGMQLQEIARKLHRSTAEIEIILHVIGHSEQTGEVRG